MAAGARFSVSSGLRSLAAPDASTMPAAGFSRPAASRRMRPLPPPSSPMIPMTTPSGAPASNSWRGAAETRRNTRAISRRLAGRPPSYHGGLARMEDPQVLDRMRSDWNERASEDAYYYVAFGRREQDDEEFFSTAGDLVKGLTSEFKRLPGRGAALEIGCGPGRLMRPLSRQFG